MSLDSFLTALDRHGADLDAWPNELRDDARALAASELSAAAALQALVEVEAWLGGSRTPADAPAPAWIADVVRLPQQGRFGALSGRRRLAAIAAAAGCLIVGLTVGAAPHFAPEPSDVLAQALGGSAGVFDAG